jgi:hypothetical protein
MIALPVAHVGGIPIEETLGSLGPALLVAFGVAWATLRARLRPGRSRASAPAQRRKTGPRRAGGSSCTRSTPTAPTTTSPHVAHDERPQLH